MRNYGDKMDEITLDTINEKADLTLEKLDELLELFTDIDSKVVEVLSKVNGLTPPSGSSDDGADETTSTFKTELQQKIDSGLPYDLVKDWIISKLAELGIYSEDDVNIKIFVHKTGDMMLEVKLRPYIYWGDCIQFFQDAMGDADYFETSRYNMKNIMWWRLNKNMQMEEQTSDSSIIDNVTEDWGDNDNVNQHIGQGK